MGKNLLLCQHLYSYFIKKQVTVTCFIHLLNNINYEAAHGVGVKLTFADNVLP